MIRRSGQPVFGWFGFNQQLNPYLLRIPSGKNLLHGYFILAFMAHGFVFHKIEFKMPCDKCNILLSYNEKMRYVECSVSFRMADSPLPLI